MVCGGKLICDARNTAILANPDVAGYGVLVSFVLSALLTVGAVICAYLSDSMPEKYLSKTDEAFIKEFQRIKKNLPFRLLPAKLRPPPTERQGKLSREKRVEAFDRFILSLSDQQLATGLAILIAAIANQCTLSPPEFRIAFSLAWFSTTTHLATLDSLRHYFTKHKTLRNVRVFGMLTFMVLFLYCFIVVLVMENSPDNIVPVQCHVQGSVRTYKDEEITLSTYFWPWAMTALIIIFAYKSKLLRTYSYGSNDFIGLGRYSKNVLSLWSRWRYPKEMQLPIMEPDQWNYVRKEAAEELFAGRRQRLLMDLVLKSKDPAFITELANAWKYAEYRYWHSMLPLVPPMTFMLVFGLAQMILFRWELGDYKAIEVDTSMGFGQIIPLILLALPFLAAAEIYQESRSASPPGTKSLTSNTVVISEPSSAVSPTRVDRMPTLRVTSSADVNDPRLVQLEEQGRKYDNEIANVKRYFYREVEEVKMQHTNAKTDQEMRVILIRKEQLLKDTKTCFEAENKMKGKGVPLKIASLLYMRVTFLAAAAILLNLPRRHFIGGIIGGALLLMQLSSQLYVWISTLRGTEVKVYVRLLAKFDENKQGRLRAQLH